MERRYAVVGLGYVGLELATRLSSVFTVKGYDINSSRIEQLKQGYDKNKIFTKAQLRKYPLTYTDSIEDIQSMNFYIVSVPTPAFYYELPNLDSLTDSTTNLAKIIKKDDIIVYESTVYPGTTEEICIKILEDISQLKCGEDFNVGFSPERINPKDGSHSIFRLTKVAGAQNKHTLTEIVNTYQKIFKSVYPVSSIKVAEASKILENTQRDINIAFMNEFTTIMHALDIDYLEVLEAAKTKWNFVDFKPGFVGGHCISVDPLYLAFQAKRHSVTPEMIMMARQINDNMTHFVINQMIKLLIKKGSDFSSIKLGILGVTYKKDVPDIRNSLVLKLIKEIKSFQIDYCIHDPLADKAHLLNHYNIQLVDYDDLNELDIIILAVGHHYYFKKGLVSLLEKLHGPSLFMDMTYLFAKEDKSHFKNITFWNL